MERGSAEEREYIKMSNREKKVNLEESRANVLGGFLSLYFEKGQKKMINMLMTVKKPNLE